MFAGRRLDAPARGFSLPPRRFPLLDRRPRGTIPDRAPCTDFLRRGPMRTPRLGQVAALALPLILFIPARVATSDPSQVARLKHAALMMRAHELRQARDARWAGRSLSWPRVEEGDASASAAPELGARAGQSRPFSTTALGPNVRANNRATDVVTCPGPVPCSTQSAEGI